MPKWCREALRSIGFEEDRCCRCSCCRRRCRRPCAAILRLNSPVSSEERVRSLSAKACSKCNTILTRCARCTPLANPPSIMAFESTVLRIMHDARCRNDPSDATRVTLDTGSQVHPRVPSHLPPPASHRQRGGRWRLVSCRQDKYVFCTAASASIIVIVLRCRG